MAITPLGPDATAALLAGCGRVTIVNRTPADAAATIVAVAVARHRDGVDPQLDAAYSLQLGADQSVEVEAVPPLAAPPDATEVVLRVFIAGQGMADAYVIARRSGDDSTGRVEVGLRRNSGVVADNENTVPGYPEFIIYALPAE